MNEFLRTLGHLLTLFYYWIESMILFFVPKQFKMKDVTDELVLITGSGSGIGRLTAIKFAEKGANLVLWDINENGIEETAKLVREKGTKAFTYTVDVTNREAVYKTASKVKEDAGVVTILINNAGIVQGKPILELDDKQVEKTMNVNALSHVWMIKSFLPDMLQNDHGHIVSIASLAGLGGVPRLADYCASKFAAVGLMDSLEVELHAMGRKNIKLTTICPFFINTGMFNGINSKLFSILEPEYVAEEILTSILCEKGTVIIPRSFYVLIAMKTMMPNRSLLALHDAFGGSESMDLFTGRTKDKIH
ncbi:short-chain dehydrogenase/reductase family 16C member 6 [Parasteatoda tepidariorum]|uniref:short-chain dehydrogenase/reductase family 16C member 6 n=1 Tax=Parasteatoda tepidariorum TaxID=114398 RepID=UPI00077FCB23|nr:short-chain dehydrogenase/reductase family 16C member 6 [Parasteatoda tepidariorum]